MVEALSDRVRAMNCYYSNLIEGHNTHPIDTRTRSTSSALSEDFRTSKQIMARTPEPAPRTKHWLLKSEPDVFSWADLVARGNTGEPWSGVRNYQARNNMRAMKVGDRGFFYHSNIGLEIVGICEVIAPAHPDPTDGTGKWECVDVKGIAPVPAPVSMLAIKGNPKLAGMVLVNNSRLSVQPVTADEWAEVCRMGGLVEPRATTKKPRA